MSKLRDETSQERGSVRYSEINTLARELAFLVMWLTRPTSFRSLATSSAVSAWMGDPPTRYKSPNLEIIRKIVHNILHFITNIRDFYSDVYTILNRI